MLQNIVLLSLAGAAGTLSRYGMGELVSHLAGRRFPWSTLVINALGSLLFGLVWTLVVKRELLSPQAGLVILTGFMGAFTTFSTFAFESFHLIDEGQWSLALANLAVENGLGLMAVWLGCAIARWV